MNDEENLSTCSSPFDVRSFDNLDDFSAGSVPPSQRASASSFDNRSFDILGIGKSLSDKVGVSARSTDCSLYLKEVKATDKSTAWSTEIKESAPFSPPLISHSASNESAHSPVQVKRSWRFEGASNPGGSPSPGSSSSFTSFKSYLSRSPSMDSRGNHNRSSPSTDALRLSIQDVLLRGVSIKKVLRRGGQHLKPGLQQFGGGELYNMSKQMMSLDVFYSHCWLDGRWPKYIALCLTHNGTAAFLASLMWSVAMFILQRQGLVPLLLVGATSWSVAGEANITVQRGCWCALGSPVIYLIFVLWWQSMAECFRRPIYVFLDKLCIHQTDEQLKAQAILGIGGILNSSSQMVVLWSPNYFARLWCMFEVAVWCALERADKLVIVPLARTMMLPVGLLFLYVCLLMALGVESIDSSSCDWHWWSALIGSCVACLSLTSIIFHLLRGTMRDLRGFKKQLAHASIRKTKCFCCTNNHRYPDTSLKVPCDRELVMNTIGILFPGENSSEAFDRRFRSDWITSVWHTLGTFDSLPLRDCLVIVAPVVWFGFDVLSAPGLVGRFFVHVALTRTVYVLDSLITIRITLTVCRCLAKKRRRKLHDILISCLGAFIMSGAGAGLYFKSFKAQQLRPLWPQVLNLFVCICTVCHLWCKCLFVCCRAHLSKVHMEKELDDMEAIVAMNTANNRDSAGNSNPASPYSSAGWGNGNDPLYTSGGSEQIHGLEAFTGVIPATSEQSNSSWGSGSGCLSPHKQQSNSSWGNGGVSPSRSPEGSPQRSRSSSRAVTLDGVPTVRPIDQLDLDQQFSRTISKSVAIQVHFSSEAQSTGKAASKYAPVSSHQDDPQYLLNVSDEAEQQPGRQGVSNEAIHDMIHQLSGQAVCNESEPESTRVTSSGLEQLLSRQTSSNDSGMQSSGKVFDEVKENPLRPVSMESVPQLTAKENFLRPVSMESVPQQLTAKVCDEAEQGAGSRASCEAAQSTGTAHIKEGQECCRQCSAESVPIEITDSNTDAVRAVHSAPELAPNGRGWPEIGFSNKDKEKIIINASSEDEHQESTRDSDEQECLSENSLT